MESRQASETIRVRVALDDDAQRDALAAQLSEFDDVVVVDRAKDMRRALHDVQRSRLDLVFLDRAMLTAREMRRVREMLAQGTPLIAFVMTHPQPVDAFEPDAVDYLPIPASSQRTRTTIRRAKERLDVPTPFPTSSRTERNENASHTRLQAPTQFLRRISARTNDGFRIIPVDELVSAVARREYLHLTTSNGDRHMTLYALKDLQAKLDPAAFVRVSRNTLVNVAFVRRVVPGRSGLLTVALSNGDQHEASRRRGRELREWLLRL